MALGWSSGELPLDIELVEHDLAREFVVGEGGTVGGCDEGRPIRRFLRLEDSPSGEGVSGLRERLRELDTTGSSIPEGRETISAGRGDEDGTVVVAMNHGRWQLDCSRLEAGGEQRDSELKRVSSSSMSTLPSRRGDEHELRVQVAEGKAKSVDSHGKAAAFDGG